MKQGFAVISLFQGIVDDVKIFFTLERAQENWFEQIKHFLEENPQVVEFCEETGGNFKKFVKAVEKNNIEKTLKFYNKIEWDEDDVFVIETCEVYD